jgi:hypothetical protein
VLALRVTTKERADRVDKLAVAGRALSELAMRGAAHKAAFWNHL